MAITTPITHKRGDTFDQLAAIPDVFIDGYFVGWQVSAQVRTAKYGKLQSELICTWVDPLTTRTLSVKALDTTEWEVGPSEMDIQFVRDTDGYTISTATVAINVIHDVTREEP